MDDPSSTKQCSRCKDSKNRSEFSLAKRSKDGLQSWCKSCDAAYKTERGYTKRLQELHKKEHDDAFYQLAYSSSRSKRCPACQQTKSVREFHKNKSGSDGFAAYCKPCFVEKSRPSVRKRRYGLALAEYDNLLLRQNGKCAICKRPPYTKKGLVVDHCHRTGAIRGILCSRCNSALGLLDDDPALVEQALAYLRLSPQRCRSYWAARSSSRRES
jgi:Recombination endonuclease VII